MQWPHGHATDARVALPPPTAPVQWSLPRCRGRIWGVAGIQCGSGAYPDRRSVDWSSIHERRAGSAETAGETAREPAAGCREWRNPRIRWPALRSLPCSPFVPTAPLCPPASGLDGSGRSKHPGCDAFRASRSAAARTRSAASGGHRLFDEDLRRPFNAAGRPSICGGCPASRRAPTAHRAGMAGRKPSRCRRTPPSLSLPGSCQGLSRPRGSLRPWPRSARAPGPRGGARAGISAARVVRSPGTESPDAAGSPSAVWSRTPSKSSSF